MISLIPRKEEHMKRVCLPLALVALGALLASPPASAQSCSIGGHNETSENFAPGGWSIIPGTPGTISGAPSGSHLVISEVAPRGAGAGAIDLRINNVLSS